MAGRKNGDVGKADTTGTGAPSKATKNKDDSSSSSSVRRSSRSNRFSGPYYSSGVHNKNMSKTTTEEESPFKMKMDPFLLRKLKLKRTDGEYYDCQIVGYNPESDKPFCLLFMIGQVEEHHQWINLKEVDADDIEWTDGLPAPDMP